MLFLRDLHFHDLRHESTCRLAMKIPNVLMLARITGHKEPQATITTMWKSWQECRVEYSVYDVNIQNMIDLEIIAGFDWDSGNARKNEKHGVSQTEAEQVFCNEPLLLLADPNHSKEEQRYHALGKTDAGRLLHITFTLRGNGALIRVISARDMHRKERGYYEQET